MEEPSTVGITTRKLDRGAGECCRCEGCIMVFDLGTGPGLGPGDGDPHGPNGDEEFG